MPDPIPPTQPMAERAPVAPGNTAPATVAPDSQGLKMRGALDVYIGMQALKRGAETLDETDKKAVLEALGILAPKFGVPSGDLTRAEIKLLGEQAPAMAKPQPPQAAAIQQRLKSMGLGGGGAAPTPEPSQAAPAA